MRCVSFSADMLLFSLLLLYLPDALRLSGLRVLSRVSGIGTELRLMRCAYQAYGF